MDVSVQPGAGLDCLWHQRHSVLTPPPWAAGMFKVREEPQVPIAFARILSLSWGHAPSLPGSGCYLLVCGGGGASGPLGSGPVLSNLPLSLGTFPSSVFGDFTFPLSLGTFSFLPTARHGDEGAASSTFRTSQMSRELEHKPPPGRLPWASLLYSFIHLFIQQIHFETLICSRYCSRDWKQSSEQRPGCCPRPRGDHEQMDKPDDLR